MRAPKNQATGTSGETEVLAEFERLGWAGWVESRHDTGTDLYLRPRDDRRFELGVMMGAQVKTGKTFFQYTERDAAGETTGWWFRTDQEHFDYWLHHALPHVVILRDQAKDTSYWVHVTPDRVVPTGKGAKILVPASQIIDSRCNGQLTTVALTQLPTPTWDGTAWTGARNLSPSDEIRHALITPRLIAPHPNLAPDSIRGVEALAMQILIRDKIAQILDPRDVFERSQSDQKWSGLSLDAARKDKDWCWRATAALHIWLYQNEPTDLLQLTASACSPAERTAATVLACLYHFDENDPDAALVSLQHALEHDDYFPVDHAWLEAQRARALLETGHADDAFDLAMKTQRIYRENPSDVTAAAIAGACARTSFTAKGWAGDSVANTVQLGDNAASWWRTQVMFYGLSDHLSEDFRTWCEDGSIRVGHIDTARTHLTAASMLASCTGDQGWWRSASGALAEHLLIGTNTARDPDMVAMWLTSLRHSGDADGTGNATRRIVNTGPAMAARIATSEINLARSSRTTALADIKMLAAAGDVLTETRADELAAWVLDTLQNPQRYSERVRPRFIVNRELILLLKPMIWAMGQKTVHDVIDHFLSQPPVTDDFTAQTLAGLIQAIPRTAWRENDRQRAAERANSDASYLREAYLEVAASSVRASQEEIRRRACAGDVLILDAIDDVRTLPADVVDTLGNTLCTEIDALIKQATEGVYSWGGHDTGKTLALLNIWHPGNARWDHIQALLTAPSVSSRDRSGTLELLATLGYRLSDETKSQLLDPVAALKQQTLRCCGIFDEPDIRPIATEAFASLIDEASRQVLVRDLLGKDAEYRAASARVIERFGDKAETEILLALAGDANEAVRNAAFCGLSNLVANEGASEAITALLSQVLESGGRHSGANIVSRLKDHPEVPAVSDLLQTALRHPSAQVRKAAGHALSAKR